MRSTRSTSTAVTAPRTRHGSSSSTRVRTTSTSTGRRSPRTPSPSSAPKPAVTPTIVISRILWASCRPGARRSAHGGQRTTSGSTTPAPSASTIPSSGPRAHVRDDDARRRPWPHALRLHRRARLPVGGGHRPPRELGGDARPGRGGARNRRSLTAVDAVATPAHTTADPGVPTTGRWARRRMPEGPESLRRAAWAGLQDSMPRAALLSLHARVEKVEPSTWDDPSLAQLWGPRYQTYVVAERDFALFSLGRLPDSAKGRLRAEQMAERLRLHLGGERMADREAGRALGMNTNAFRYAAPTGTVAIRWDGARAPTIWTVAAPEIDPADATRELARRYLHVFGPTTADGFARWAGISRSAAAGCIRLARSIPAAGPIAARRRAPARSRRAGHARRRDLLRRPRACCRAAMPTTCSRGQNGSSSSPERISGYGSGRLACGRARSSSKARYVERGDARSTSCGSTPGDACRVGCAMRSRPRPAPYRSRASIEASTSSGTRERVPAGRAGNGADIER